MLNPGNFFTQKTQNYAPPMMNSTSIHIDRLRDEKKSKWDEPLHVPAVLYAKFKINPPFSTNSEQNNYPSSLLDYIRRAYEKCKDDSQRKLMETELRKVISHHTANLNTLKWETTPLPNLRTQVKPTPRIPEQKPQVNIVKKETPRFPPGYNIGDQPSKAKVIAQKRLEKLEQKLKKQGNQKIEEQQPTHSFIGFNSVPQPPKIVNPEPKSFQIKPDPPISINFAQKPPQPPQPPKPEKQEKSTKQVSKPTKINKKELEIIEQAKEDEALNQMAKRFVEFNKLQNNRNQKIMSMQNTIVDDDITEKIVGKSKSIEKPYLRITGRPNPQTIRPEPILRKALHFFLDQYKKGKSYEYLIEQFRSIRQDLTVQHIKNSLTVQVYEENLKLSLFEKDTAQFMHCQTTLWQLYRQGIIYTKESRAKFIGYQMITLIMQGRYEDLEFMLVEMPGGNLEVQQVQQCLRLKRILMLGNYRGFFDFYGTRDQVCRSLLNQYIDRVRVKCLLMVCKTFGEKVPITTLAGILGEDEDLLEAIIRQEGGIIQGGNFMLKPSYDKLLKSEHLASKKVSILFN